MRIVFALLPLLLWPDNVFSRGEGDALFINEEFAVFPDRCQFPYSGDTGSAEGCQVRKVVKNVCPGDVLRTSNRHVVFCKKGEKLGDIGLIRDTRMHAEVSPVQAVEVVCQCACER